MERNGLSQVEYCRRNKISLKSFQYWERKTGRSSAPALVELPLFKSAPVCASPSYPQLCLVVDQHYRIKIGKGFDCEDLRACRTCIGADMIYLPSHMRVFLAPGSTDMRKAINSLSILVEDTLRLDSFSGHLFVFCNRGKRILKILYWDRNGFCLWQKRLEKHRFKWPQNRDEVMEIGATELSFILEGLDIRAMRPYAELKYRSVI